MYTFIKKTILIFTLLLYYSCSNSDPHRYPSSTKIESLPVNVSDILSFDRTVEKIPDSELRYNPKDYISSKLISSLPKRKFLNIAFEETEDLPSDKAFRVFPEISSDGNYVIKIFHSANSFDDKLALSRLTYFLQQLNNRKYFNLYQDFFEMVFNARLGDLGALDNLLRIKTESLSPNSMVFKYKDFDVTNVGNGKTLDQAKFTTKSFGKNLIKDDFWETYTEYNKPLQEEMTQYRTALDPLIKAEKKEVKSLEVSRKAIIKQLDKAGDMAQLKALAAAGKRQEAAHLIETYLPKEHMTPSEREYWNTALDIIRHPADLKDRVLVFRGIDDDMVYPFIEGGKEIDKELSIKESKGIFMSSIMTKNQGTWNRRLRSLQTMYDKVLNQNVETGTNEFSKSARMTTMFYQHALNPQGSPFLSWTPKIKTAHFFGKKRASAFLIDPRLLMANYASVFSTELELLTPLITFPDEMVAIHDQSIHGKLDAEGRKSYFLNKTKEKLIQEYGQEDGEKNFLHIKAIFDDHNLADNVAELTSPKKESFLRRWGKATRDFFKRLFGKGKKVASPEPVATQTKETCVYFIKTLFNTP